jgi:hypothetical protein
MLYCVVCSGQQPDGLIAGAGCRILCVSLCQGAGTKVVVWGYPWHDACSVCRIPTSGAVLCSVEPMARHRTATGSSDAGSVFSQIHRMRSLDC